MKDIRLGPLTATLAGGEDGNGGGSGPVVVLLHGFGAPGGDLVPLARALPVPAGLRFVFPAAPLELEPGAPAAYAPRAWWLIDIARIQRLAAGGDIEALFEEVPRGIAAAREAVVAMLDEIERQLGVPSEQIVLGGFSQGAMLATDVLLREPRAFAGLVVLSGTLIARREWTELMPARRGLPVLQSHGRSDPILPFVAAQRLHELLTQAGLNADFLPFNGGHGIPEPVLERLASFLTNAARPPP